MRTQPNMMKNYFLDLTHMPLFSSIPPEDIPGLLECTCARRLSYRKNEIIIEEGGLVSEFGILLSGRGRAMIVDESGRIVTITLLKKGNEIGAILASSNDHRSPVSVQALEDAEVLKIPFARVLSRCEKSCPSHDQLLKNYIGIVAEKGLELQERISCLLKPSIREKVLGYLSKNARDTGSRAFCVPFDRSGMAEYLNVERSALSRELSAMKRDGLIDFHKNCFRLL